MRKKTKREKRRIQIQVSEHIGARLDRLAEVYRNKQTPGASFKASDALRAAVYVGIEAEEKRLGLAPLPVPEEPAPTQRTSKKRRARVRSRRRSRGRAAP